MSTTLKQCHVTLQPPTHISFPFNMMTTTHCDDKAAVPRQSTRPYTATTRLIWHIWRPHLPLSRCVMMAWQYGRGPLVAWELRLYFFNLNLLMIMTRLSIRLSCTLPYDDNVTMWQQCLVTLWPPPHTTSIQHDMATTTHHPMRTPWMMQRKKLVNLDQGRSIRTGWCVVCTRYFKFIFLMF